MNVKSVIWNSSEGRFRALLRIIIQTVIAVILIALVFISVIETLDSVYKSGGIPINPEVFDKLMDILAGILLSAAILLSMKIAARFIDKRSFKDYGFNINPVWFRQYFMGFLTGAVVMSVIFIFEYLLGYVTIERFFSARSAELPVLLVFTYPVIKAVCVGTYEEALSRGYHITNLREGLTGFGKIRGRMPAILSILFSSLFFGLLHLSNANVTLLSIINNVLIGVLLGTAFVFTGQLAMPIGLHMSWNLFQGLVFGFPVSGDKETANIISVIQNGPEWITGGAYGPEGGLAGLIACISGFIILYIFFKFSNKSLSFPNHTQIINDRNQKNLKRHKVGRYHRLFTGNKGGKQDNDNRHNIN